MRFSICIPNFNYGRYLGITLDSVLQQAHPDFEVVVSDNASTDNSVAVAGATGDPRVRVHVNSCNIGFAGNLDRAGGMATGDFMIMLSSDDVMRPGALEMYASLLGAVGADRDVAVTSSHDVIDAAGMVTGGMGLRSTWRDTDHDAALSERFGVPIYRARGDEMLRRSLATMKNPLPFCSTAYPRRLYAKVEGYGGGRTINPDKWFHWKLCAVTDEIFFIDAPLFAWRWHPQNQTHSFAAHIKYVIDDYLTTIELDGSTLEKVGVPRQRLTEAYAEHLIGRLGLAALARYGDRDLARRLLHFGRAVYPREVGRNWKARLLALLLATGPLAPPLARAARFAKNRGRALPPSPWGS